MLSITNDLTTVNANSQIYYSSIYWNSYEYVWFRLNERISGQANKHWFKHFYASVGERRFKKALILCCGNGWVERELLAYGLFDEAVGVDYSDTLLDQARMAAGDLPLRYYQMDINTAVFPEAGYDLIINYAAAHHIAYIDRVFRALASLLPEDGYFVSYDYVGPHRNQYSALQWAAVHELNQSLPTHLQQTLAYPHLPTMLDLDPTEAIHSELIVPVMNRYFVIEEQRLLGGALAYPILTHNQHFLDVAEAEQQAWLQHIMDADSAYLTAFPESSLFDYIVARPHHSVLQHTHNLTAWAEDELHREQFAQQAGGHYYQSPNEDNPVNEFQDSLQAEYTRLEKIRDSLLQENALLQTECNWRQETQDNLLAERLWLWQRNRELELTLERLELHPLVQFMRVIKRLLSIKYKS